MQFRENMDVLDAVGEKAGELERVVVDPREGQVTHVVVRKGGFLGVDKVVPVDTIWYTDDDGIHLKIDQDGFEDLPEYEDVSFIPLSDEERRRVGYAGDIAPTYWYPVVGTPPMMWSGGAWSYVPPYEVEQESNIPPGTVPLKEGAEVIDGEGKKVGDVEQVLTANEKDITHLVVTKGGLLGSSRKLIPAAWIQRLKEDAVQLSVSADFVESLKEYD